MIDLATGKVIELQLRCAAKVGNTDACFSAFQPSGIESRPNSRLLEIRGANITGKDGGAYLRTSYFVFETIRSGDW